MRVWIDTDECMGVGTCEQLVPEVFTARRDGRWAVREDAGFFGAQLVFDGDRGDGHGPDGVSGMARVPSGFEEYVVEVAEQCPGECVHLEV